MNEYGISAEGSMSIAKNTEHKNGQSEFVKTQCK